MVEGKGFNDMPRGWARENEWNKKVYKKWHDMLRRCYSKGYHEIRPTYIGCKVCDDWLILSNFVKDFKLIDGYDETKFLNGELQLDKDIKSNGHNKEYSLENCILINHSENIKQAMRTRDNSYLQNENNPMWNKGVKIAQYDKETHELIKIWNSAMEIQRILNISNGNIITCCKFWEINCNEEEWYKIHKSKPIKYVRGFVWQYVKEED